VPKTLPVEPPELELELLLDDELPLELELLPELELLDELEDELPLELELLLEPELLDELEDELELPPSPPQAASTRDTRSTVQPRVCVDFMMAPGVICAYSMLAVVATEEGEASAATGAAIDVRAPPLPIRNPYRPADPAA
jgi:hypothetical protein